MSRITVVLEGLRASKIIGEVVPLASKDNENQVMCTPHSTIIGSLHPRVGTNNLTGVYITGASLSIILVQLSLLNKLDLL